MMHSAETVREFREWQEVYKEKEYELEIQENSKGDAFFQISSDGQVLCEYVFLEEVISFMEGYTQAQKCEA